jgi:photosystem I P700 chlorophyll a apoprotein A2
VKILLRRIWYSIGTAHDLESHDDVTEETLYQRFSLLILVIAIIFLWTAGNLFHAWQVTLNNVLNPLKVKPIAHGIWDPHFETALKAFTRGGVIYPVNMHYQGLSMVVHNWYENESRFICCFGFLINCFVSFITSWLVTSSTTI